MIPNFEMEQKGTYRGDIGDNLCPPPSKEKIIKKGLIWVQQDKLFSRWKEMMLGRQWSLTKDHLNTFLQRKIKNIFSACV